MEFRLLGPVEALVEGMPVELGTARMRDVLVVLLIEPNTDVSPDRLLDEVWGDSPGASIAALHSCVYRLRRQLPGISLLRGPNGYRMEVDPSEVDLLRFRQLAASGREALEAGDRVAAASALRSALELFRGEPFAGVDVPLVRQVAAELTELRLAATEQCLAAELALGRHDAVVTDLERLTVQHPLRERLWELLMSALARCGRQADALAAYQRLYRLLSEELGTEPSAPVRELHERILRGESDRPPTESSIVPRQLPVDHSWFVGRKGYLADLDVLLEAARLAVVTGPAGIGKTTLVLHWAHGVAEQFPDGQLYVDLRGFDPSGQPLSAETAVRGFLHALGVRSDRLPPDGHAQLALYRSLTAERRLLVVLDNAVDSAHALPLLPGGTLCRAVVTSRTQLTGLVATNGACPIALDLLDPSEARDLLAGRLGLARGQDQSVVDRILSACGHLPLALAVVAARAVVEPRRPLAVLADQLTDASSTLDTFYLGEIDTDLRAVFSWSYDHLAPGAARAFRLLSVHPGPDFALEAAASILGAPVGETRRMLDDLTRVHLLAEDENARYSFHDLLRVYAGERAANDNDRADAFHRLLDHYLHSAHRARVIVSPAHADLTPPPPASGTLVAEPPGSDAALTWYQTERHNIVRIVEASSARKYFDHTWRLTYDAMFYFDRRYLWTDAEHCLRLSLRAANEADSAIGRAKTLNNLARTCTQVGKFDEAVAAAEQAIALFEDLGLPEWAAYSHGHLAYHSEVKKDAAGGIEHAKAALDCFIRGKNALGIARALNAIGWAEAHLGNYTTALALCEDSLRQSRLIKDDTGTAATLDSLGLICLKIGQIERSIEYHRESLELFRTLQKVRHTAMAGERLGDAHEAAGDNKAAQQHWQEALAILDDLDHPDAVPLRQKLDGVTEIPE